MSAQDVHMGYNWRMSNTITQKTLERIEKWLEVQVEQNSALIAQNAALIEQGDYHIPSPTREQMQNARGDDE